MTARLHDTDPVTDVELDMDDSGEKVYKLTYLVDCDEGDGPLAALECPGLPRPGDWYQLGTDSDLYAWCWWQTSVKPFSPANEPITHYKVTKTFSTKPEKNQQCRENAKEDPLQELPKISGSYSKYTEEAVLDRFGKAITYSSFERIRGPINEWDKNRISVKIQQNVASFYLGVQLPSLMIDCVNQFTLWGFPPRCIKMVPSGWEKLYYGPCIPYYSRTLEFDIRYNKTEAGVIETWDRYILDESDRVLQGTWVGSGSTLAWVPSFQVAGMTGTPNPNDPTHFMAIADVKGNKWKRITLNGAGVPANVLSANGTAHYVSLQSGTNLNHPLNDLDWWLEIHVEFLNVLPAWDVNAWYKVGDLVQMFNDDIYISLQLNASNDPATSPTLWTLLGTALTDKGLWDDGTSYQLGDVANNNGLTGKAGYIFVQRYGSADFSLLGIPSTL